MKNASNSFLFTSESVTEGHPDKVCDQIADAVLDAILAKEIELANQGYVAPDGAAANPRAARVACEVLVTKGLVVLGGELRTEVYVDIAQVARQVISDIGYNNPELGFDAKTCGILNAIQDQSPDISQAVDLSQEAKRQADGLNQEAKAGSDSEQVAKPASSPNQQAKPGSEQNDQSDADYDRIGAGDQGMVFGYATNETTTFMPMPIFLAHRLAERLAVVRKDLTLPYLRPDGKTQVGVRYENGKPVQVEKILISSQSEEGISIDQQLKPDLIREVIGPVMQQWNVNWQGAEILINPSGCFEKGGPAADTGLTGRKIIVDTYGGLGRHGGGSFSGKDATKVDRSAAYAMRWVAKNIVAAGLAERCEIQVAYAIGMARPFSMMVDSFGTGTVSDDTLRAAVEEVFDLRPAAIIDRLDLVRPIYRQTAVYGHFGRELPHFTWEKTDRVDQLIAAVAALT
ncbi:MAG: methionine adenosyltransferase [Coriobacteriales bacterium]|jgi:S-adenosylmethionine synthetase|nr:methionine adenosyltransferase [Coriobacteriales bacterium]